MKFEKKLSSAPFDSEFGVDFENSSFRIFENSSILYWILKFLNRDFDSKTWFISLTHRFFLDYSHFTFSWSL